jgi:hypothetical protein
MNLIHLVLPRTEYKEYFEIEHSHFLIYTTKLIMEGNQNSLHVISNYSSNFCFKEAKGTPFISISVTYLIKFVILFVIILRNSFVKLLR